MAPGPGNLPEWVQQGTLHFARLDGGPIEVRKTRRSSWGMHFTDAQTEVLANLYTKYADRTLALLQQAHVNSVWLTWSVGYSWEDEAEQREQCKRMVSRLHQQGMHVAAYLCAVTVFWESMFRDEPRSVRWIRFDDKGVPLRYSGGRDELRFIADVSNPEWLALAKRRVGAAIDAGFDAIFFDNPAIADEPEAFFAEIRRYIHEERHSKALLFTNYGLSHAQLNHNMDFVFAEWWTEPGVWGEEWDVGNIRRTKLLRGVLPEWKPLTTEYSLFHSGNRSTTFLAPRSQKLATAEAAAFQADHCWNMEGPFDAALMSNDSDALAAWKGIGEYRLFLEKHEDLYWKSRSVAPIAVVLPNEPIGFGWERDDSGIFDALARSSVLYDLRPASRLDSQQLHSYRAVVIQAGTPVNGLLREYRNGGGKVYTAARADERTIHEIRALLDGGPSLTIDGASHVLGNLTALGSEKGLAVHLLNYAAAPVSRVRVSIDLGRQYSGLRGKPVLFTPDRSGAVTEVRRTGTVVDFLVDWLDIYSVVVLKA